MAFKIAEDFDKAFRPEVRKACLEFTAGLRRADLDSAFEPDRPRVQTLFHVHDTDPGMCITGHHGALDGSGAAPARQQGGMHIDTSERRQFEYGLRQDQAVGRDHQQVRFQGG